MGAKIEICRPLLYRPPGSRLRQATGGPGHAAVFFDRDGTLVEHVGYLTELSQLRLLAGSAEGIQLLQDQFLIVVATNQAAVARGLIDEGRLLEVHRALAARLEERGARLDAIYACPHHPECGEPPYRLRCACRKPRPGMLLQAERDLGVQLAASYLVGDDATDIEAGQRAGVAATVLLAPPGSEAAGATYVAGGVVEAARLILGHPGQCERGS